MDFEVAPAIRDALERLPPAMRQCTLLRLDQQMQYREIAEVMNTTVNNVGVMLHTAIKNIRQRLPESALSTGPSGGEMTTARSSR